MNKPRKIEKQERLYRVFRPSYQRVEVLDSLSLEELLSEPTTELLELFIQDTVENSTITTLTKTFKRNLLGLTGVTTTSLILIPTLLKKGSAEEVACVFTSIALSLYFSERMYRISSIMEVAEEAAKKPRYHTVTIFLPLFYQQLRTYAEKRLGRIDRTLRALHVHEMAPNSSLGASKYLHHQEIRELCSALCADLSTFSQNLSESIHSLVERAEAKDSSDALPGMMNGLLRSSWRSWKEIDEQIERIENLLHLKPLLE